MKEIKVYEVGPRDGFQNLTEYIPIEEKKTIIDRLIESNLQHIQHTSFVNPKVIPQLKDAKELTQYLLEKYPNIHFFALVPNLYGAELAWNAGVKTISYVVSLSETHNKSNINRTHAESFTELKKIVDSFSDMDIILDLSTAFGCPFEGKFTAQEIIEFLKSYINLGIKKVNLCDTIGIANPKEVREVIHSLNAAFNSLELQVHIHDTRNMGMVNTLAAIESGVNIIQSTLGGLGGCPFAPGASGNLATEDVVYMLNSMGYLTNINFDELLVISKYQKKIINNGVFSGHHLTIET